MKSIPQLTKREEQTLALIASGRMRKQAAGDLAISVKTLDKHLASSYRKLHVPGQVMAAHWAIAHGLVPLAFSVPVQMKGVRA